MKITVPKSTLETALAPILKMAPVAKPSRLAVRAERQKVWICRSTGDQRLDIELPDAACDQKDGGFGIAGLEPFRLMVSAATGTRLSIEQDAAHVMLNCDDRFIGQLVPMTYKEEKLFLIPKDADSTVLPTNSANFLLQAFSCAGDARDRLALSGVNVSSRGIAGTDGKQLFHLPLPLQLKNHVTIPPSKVYATLKHLRWTSLAHWRTASGDWMFAISGDGFRYTAKALDAIYPQYWQVIPPEETNDVRFTLTPDGAQALQRFLDENTREATARMTVHPDRIELLETDNAGMTQRSGVFASSSQGTKLPCIVSIVSNNLRQFLKMGFLTLSFSSKTPGPLVSSAGTGKYLFMPCGSPRHETPATGTRPAPKPAPNPATVVTSSTNNPKEKTNMMQTITTASPSVQNPASTLARVQPAVQSNPLDETLASLASMREQLSNLEARLMEAGRKIKAALVEQKLKERQYADANRKLERIRLAV